MTATEVVRRFNRTYTQRIGALDESFLGLGLPLGLARLVFEIGTTPAGVTALELRTRLGLDSATWPGSSVAGGTRAGRRAAGPADRRRRVVTLTRSGRALRRRLDDRSEELASRLVEPLTERQRARLTEALATADLLVRAATVDLLEVDPRSATARAAVGQYFAELDARFPGGFDVAAAEADDLATPTCTPSGSWSPRATASRWPAAACASSSPGSARSSGCGCTTAGAAPASAPGCCGTSRTCPPRWGTASSGSTPTAR